MNYPIRLNHLAKFKVLGDELVIMQPKTVCSDDCWSYSSEPWTERWERLTGVKPTMKAGSQFSRGNV